MGQCKMLIMCEQRFSTVGYLKDSAIVIPRSVTLFGKAPSLDAVGYLHVDSAIGSDEVSLTMVRMQVG
jgi:hypothetical protein